MHDKLQNNKLGLIALFLTIEIMLFIAFDFAGAGIILKGSAIILAAVLVPVFLNEIKTDLSEGLYMLIMPLLIYGVVTMLAPAYIKQPSGSTASLTFMGYSLFSRIISGISLVALLLLGYFMRKSRLFAAKYVYIMIIGAFAVPVLISLIATLANYGFFHTLIYKGYVNYYNGVAYRVDNQASFLVGFQIMTVDINVLANSALFILSIGLGLLFFKPHSDKFEFVSLAIISGIGLLTIVLLGKLTMLIFLLPAIIFALLAKFNLLSKINKSILMMTLGGLFAFGLLIFVLTAFNVLNITALWQSNRLLRKLFYNSKMIRYYEVFRFSFANFNFLGQYSNWTDTTKVFPTGSFIFDVLWIDGIVGFLAIIAFLFLLIKVVVNHFKNNDDALGYKVMIVSFLLTVFARYIFFYPFNHYTYDEFRSVDNFPLISAPIFLVLIFFTGYMFSTKKDAEVVHEEN